jgi:hypothetical protein
MIKSDKYPLIYGIEATDNIEHVPGDTEGTSEVIHIAIDHSLLDEEIGAAVVDVPEKK